MKIGRLLCFAFLFAMGIAAKPALAEMVTVVGECPGTVVDYPDGSKYCVMPGGTYIYNSGEGQYEGGYYSGSTGDTTTSGTSGGTSGYSAPCFMCTLPVPQNPGCYTNTAVTKVRCSSNSVREDIEIRVAIVINANVLTSEKPPGSQTTVYYADGTSEVWTKGGASASYQWLSDHQ